MLFAKGVLDCENQILIYFVCIYISLSRSLVTILYLEETCCRKKFDYNNNKNKEQRKAILKVAVTFLISL